MSARRVAAGESGFVLIGVVIFVIALTIIGLSLFSLSTYEAQFLGRSLDDEQAFQSAMGGLERARYILCETSRLADVKSDLPKPMTWTSAIQEKLAGPDSTGAVDWNPAELVHLRVVAQVNGQERAVEATFSPLHVQNYYEQLVTVGAGIEVIPVYWGASHKNRWRTASLSGSVWESSGAAPSAWESDLALPWPAPVTTTPEVPVPAAVDFIALHAGSPPPDTPAPGTYTFHGGTTAPAYFTSDDPGHHPNWSLDDESSTPQINVDGCAVWLLPLGAYFKHPVHITGTGSPGQDCLVIVAGPADPYPWNPLRPGTSLAFEGGFSSNVPVILVASGVVIIWKNNDYANDNPSIVPDLSIFAGSVSLMGPEVGSPPPLMTLSHWPTGRLDTYFINFLLQNQALPNAGSSSGHALALRSGTWQSSAP